MTRTGRAPQILLFERMPGHGDKLADQAIGDPAADRQLVLALELFDRRAGRVIEHAGRLDLAVAVIRTARAAPPRCAATARSDRRSGSLRRGDGTGTGTVCGGRATVCVALMSMIRGPVCSTGFGVASAVFCSCRIGDERRRSRARLQENRIDDDHAGSPPPRREWRRNRPAGRSPASIAARRTTSVPTRALARLLSLRRSRTFLHRAVAGDRTPHAGAHCLMARCMIGADHARAGASSPAARARNRAAGRP